MGTGKLGTWDFVAIAVYFLMVVGVGIYSLIKANRGTVGGYFLAGRYMIWLPVGASLFASNIGSEHFIGLAGSGAAAGVAVGAFELNAGLLLQVLGHVFLPVYIASGVCTLPEYMKKRFGGKRIQVYLALLSLALYLFTKISVNLYSGALFIQEALQWNIYLSVFLLLAVTGLTTVTGGLTAVIYTDTLQMFVMIIGSVALTVISFVKVGGYTSLLHKYPLSWPNNTITEVTLSTVNYTDGGPAYQLSANVSSSLAVSSNSTCGLPLHNAWNMLRSPTDPNMPWPGFLLGQTFASIWYWCADQMMVQRALAAKSLSHAQGGTLFAGYLKMLPLFLMVLPGMISRVLYTNDVACADPVTCERVCGNPVGCSNIAYPRLVLELMPQGLKGILLSVMLAALMSDLTSIFNSASTLFTMDIYRLFRKKARNRELMITGRLAVCLMVVVGILWIPIIESMQGAQLFIYIQVISAYLSPPIAAVYTLAILWKRANEKGAFWSLMVGAAFGVFRMILGFVYPGPPCGTPDPRPAVLRIHYMYFALFLAALTMIVMVIVSLLTKPPTDKQITRTTFFTRHDKLLPDTVPTTTMQTTPEKTDDQAGTERLNATHTSKVSPVPDEVGVTKTNGETKSAGAALLAADDGALAEKADYVVKYADQSATIVQTTESTVSGTRQRLSYYCLKYLCGVEETSIALQQSEEMERHMDKVTSLDQDARSRLGLRIGVVGLLAINGFLFAFFTAGSDMFGLLR